MSGKTMPSVPILARAADMLGRYDAVFCDVWGVVHNGVRAYEAAGDALARFRAAGGVVVLVTNSPAPAASTTRYIGGLGVRRDAWDAIITSGDLTRAYIVEQAFRRIHHIGPPRDLPVFAGLDVERVTLAQARAIVCTGVLDDTRETGETYRPLLKEARARNLPFVCGNPDLIVEVGGVLLPCAGSVAAIYESMGGEVYWAGKPHAPTYLSAHKLAEHRLGRRIEPQRILAIGDALRTDIAGAVRYGIDALLIAHGIHRQELMPDGTLDPARLDRLIAASGPVRPVAAMPGLAW